jgi:hypothetical protein
VKQDLKIKDITTTESTQTLGGSITNDLQDKGVVIPNAERGTAGYIMGT